MAELFWRGCKILRQDVRILPSHFTVTCYPYKGVHVTAKCDGKILTTCHLFCTPGKIVRPRQWLRRSDYFSGRQNWEQIVKTLPNSCDPTCLECQNVTWKNSNNLLYVIFCLVKIVRPRQCFSRVLPKAKKLAVSSNFILWSFPNKYSRIESCSGIALSLVIWLKNNVGVREYPACTPYLSPNHDM